MMKARDTGHRDCTHNKPLKNFQQSLVCWVSVSRDDRKTARCVTENIFREQVTKQACRNLGFEMKTSLGEEMFQPQHQDEMVYPTVL